MRQIPHHQIILIGLLIITLNKREMHKSAANIAPIDQAIIKGILDGFGQVLEANKIEKFTSEIKKLFTTIKEDSSELSPETVYQIAFHLAFNRAKAIISKKDPKVTLPTTFEETIIKEPSSSNSLEEVRNIDIDNIPREDPSSLVQRAILEGFSSAGGLTSATTIEHINSEANKLYKAYIDKIDKYETDYQLYQQVFKAAKKIAESILAAHHELEQKQIRKDEKQRKKYEAEQAELERNRISEIAKKELQELINNLLRDDSITKAYKEALKYFKLIYIDNKKDPEVVHLFPGTSRDQRYKWKERAVSMITPMVSEESRKYISEKTKRKYASINVLCKAAQIFLYRCQKG